MDILALVVAAPSRQDRRIAAADALEASQPGPPGGGRAAGLLRPRSRSRADEAAAAGRPPGERNGP